MLHTYLSRLASLVFAPHPNEENKAETVAALLGTFDVWNQAFPLVDLMFFGDKKTDVAVMCLELALFNRKQDLKTTATSTMLRAEYQTNLIDGLQSAAIGLTVVVLWTVPIESELRFLHYTGDFFISTVLVVTSSKNPIITLFESFRELTGASPRIANFTKPFSRQLVWIVVIS